MICGGLAAQWGVWNYHFPVNVFYFPAPNNDIISDHGVGGEGRDTEASLFWYVLSDHSILPPAYPPPLASVRKLFISWLPSRHLQTQHGVSEITPHILDQVPLILA